jgi:DNA-binding winged helix-turn-helix (wHTH) protein
MESPRYRFGEFTLSPASRVLLRREEELPLIPRYFDLLLLLLRRRHEAVERREIMDAVWSDVVVSDGALSQAIRTLRRTLGDDSREPIFIRTVSRHGYRFVFPDVSEGPDDGPLRRGGATAPRSAPFAASRGGASAPSPDGADPFAAPLRRLVGETAPTADGRGGVRSETGNREDERREAAETLHALGTAEALRRLDRLPGQARARAILRDARWDVPGSGPVPLLGQPEALPAVGSLIALRLRRAARAVGSRWAAASGGGAAAGILGGLVGGIVLLLAPDSGAPANLPIVLATVGAVIGGLAAAGVGAGLAVAEALARSLRGPALVLCGGLGGGAIGFLAHVLGGWTFEGVFGRSLSAVGGGIEGLALGGAAGLGYALSTPRPGGGGMATPRGRDRLLAGLITGLCCSAAGMAVTWAGLNLSGASLNLLARAFHGSHVGLAPLARLLGEPDLGPLTRTALSAYEGLLFGCGLALGLTRRPR